MDNINLLWEIGGDLEGTCQSLERMVIKYQLEISAEILLSALLSISVEQCKGCGYWFESCELVCDDDEDYMIGYCDQCR